MVFGGVYSTKSTGVNYFNTSLRIHVDTPTPSRWERLEPGMPTARSGHACGAVAAKGISCDKAQM